MGELVGESDFVDGWVVAETVNDVIGVHTGACEERNEGELGMGFNWF